MTQQSNTMGISTLKATFSNGSEPQRNYLWEVIFPPIPGGCDPKIIEPLVQDLVIGEYSMNGINSLNNGSLQSFYAGLFTIPTFRMTMIVPNPNVLSDYLNAWKLLIVDSNGLFSVKSVYQKSIYVNFLNTSSQISGFLKCIGCFPKIFPVYQLDYRSGKHSTVLVTFSIDNIEYKDLSTT